MTRIFYGGVLAGCLPLFSLLLNAQTGSGYSRFYSQQEYQYTHSIFDQTQDDLSQAGKDAAGAHPAGAARFDAVKSQMAQLERHWDTGRYDSRAMAEAISAMKALLNDTRLAPQDSRALYDDLTQVLRVQTEYY